jgi:hypothetical protein
MTHVSKSIQDMVSSVLGSSPFKIGDVVTHPSGRTVEITEGQYWGTYGISNHWRWKEVMADGTYGPEEHGYGWR